LLALIQDGEFSPVDHSSPSHLEQEISLVNYQKALVWFRRDLRDHDHAALSAALAEAKQVYCAFVFDSEILDACPRSGIGGSSSSVNHWWNWMPRCAPKVAG
jgi:hypothetical protein